MRNLLSTALLVMLLVTIGCGGDTADPTEATDPRTDSLVERMRAAYERGDWELALNIADSTEAISTRQPDVPFIRGLIFTRLKRYSEARAAFERTLELDPNYRTAWYNLGHNAFLQRQYRDALVYYEKERALVKDASRRATDPSEGNRQALPAIFAQIGRTYALLGVQDSARIAYEEALVLDSTYAVAHAWLSELKENQGQVEEAFVHARRALEGDPDEVGYAYRAGVLLFQLGRFDEAALLLSAVVQRWPGHEGATYNLGRALIALGREQEGQAMLDRVEGIQRLQEQALLAQRAVEIHPEDPERWIHLARLMMQSGYYDKAEEALTSALTRKPEDLALRHDLANLALVRGDTTLAVRRLQEVLHRDSTFADAWLNLGIIHAMSGRRQEAQIAWNRVLQHNPDDPDAKSYLAGLK